MTTKRQRSTWVEVGSGNAFADLGLKDSDQLLARSQIGFHVFKILEEKRLKTARYRWHSWDCAIRRIAPDERTLQPLHDGQVA